MTQAIDSKVDFSPKLPDLKGTFEVLSGNEFFIKKDNNKYEIEAVYEGSGGIKTEYVVVNPDVIIIPEGEYYRFSFGDKEHNETELPSHIKFTKVKDGNPLEDSSVFLHLEWKSRYEVVSILDRNGVVFEHLEDTNNLMSQGFYNCAFLERVRVGDKIVSNKNPVAVCVFGETYLSTSRAFDWVKESMREESEILNGNKQ